MKHVIVPTALWMKEMRNSGRSGMTSYCYIVCCESSSWLRLKLGHEGRIVLAKITELEGRLKCR